MRNLITDVNGLSVGNAHDEKLASGVTALIFDRPASASIAIHGGAPGVRDTALLAPGMTVGQVDALVLSGGSAFGLDSMGGVQALLREKGRGFDVRGVKVPIVPGAILFDLLNGGDKAWARMPPYWELGYKAAQAATGKEFALGTVGAGFGATTANFKGGLGSASAKTARHYTVGALVAVNAVGSATIKDGPHFWAGQFEHGTEFGGYGAPARLFDDDLVMRLKGDAPQNTTIAIVATDARFGKEECARIALMAQGGMARALRPTHAPMDGDIVFAAATGRHPGTITARDLTEIGLLAADCLARAIARAVFEATALPFKGALPAFRDRHAG
jgi:L-aminopeptidase/D-esterase-like protein